MLIKVNRTILILYNQLNTQAEQEMYIWHITNFTIKYLSRTIEYH